MSGDNVGGDNTMTRKKALRILGLNDGASWEEIRSAYKKQALKEHPDKNGNSEESKKRFQSLSNAYSFLEKIHQAGEQLEYQQGHHTHHNTRKRQNQSNVEKETLDTLNKIVSILGKLEQIDYFTNQLDPREKVDWKKAGIDISEQRAEKAELSRIFKGIQNNSSLCDDSVDVALKLGKAGHVRHICEALAGIGYFSSQDKQLQILDKILNSNNIDAANKLLILLSLQGGGVNINQKINDKFPHQIVLDSYAKSKDPFKDELLGFLIKQNYDIIAEDAALRKEVSDKAPEIWKKSVNELLEELRPAAKPTQGSRQEAKASISYKVIGKKGAKEIMLIGQDKDGKEARFHLAPRAPTSSRHLNEDQGFLLVYGAKADGNSGRKVLLYVQGEELIGYDVRKDSNSGKYFIEEPTQQIKQAELTKIFEIWFKNRLESKLEMEEREARAEPGNKEGNFFNGVQFKFEEYDVEHIKLSWCPEIQKLRNVQSAGIQPQQGSSGPSNAPKPLAPVQQKPEVVDETLKLDILSHLYSSTAGTVRKVVSKLTRSIIEHNNGEPFLNQVLDNKSLTWVEKLEFANNLIDNGASVLTRREGNGRLPFEFVLGSYKNDVSDDGERKARDELMTLMIKKTYTKHENIEGKLYIRNLFNSTLKTIPEATCPGLLKLFEEAIRMENEVGVQPKKPAVVNAPVPESSKLKVSPGPSVIPVVPQQQAPLPTQRPAEAKGDKNVPDITPRKKSEHNSATIDTPPQKSSDNITALVDLILPDKGKAQTKVGRIQIRAFVSEVDKVRVQFRNALTQAINNNQDVKNMLSKLDANTAEGKKQLENIADQVLSAVSAVQIQGQKKGAYFSKAIATDNKLTAAKLFAPLCDFVVMVLSCIHAGSTEPFKQWNKSQTTALIVDNNKFQKFTEGLGSEDGLKQFNEMFKAVAEAKSRTAGRNL